MVPHPIRANRCDLLSTSCVCVLECDPHDIGIAVSYYIVLHLFLHQMAKIFFSAGLLLSVCYTRLMRPNKVETGRDMVPYDVGDQFWTNFSILPIPNMKWMLLITETAFVIERNRDRSVAEHFINFWCFKMNLSIRIDMRYKKDKERVQKLILKRH